MDVSLFMPMFIVYLTYGLVTCRGQEKQEAVNSNINQTSVNATKCMTARQLAGLCVQRQYCDYSTDAIDLTLFAPHGYIRPCGADEVCCPAGSLVRVETQPAPNDTDDDDDF